MAQTSYPRYLQYTKGFTQVGNNKIQNGTVEYTRFGSEYFSGANVGIYFGDVLVDEIFGLQFNLQEQLMPVYGYGSYTYDAVAKGQRIINGTFTLYFKEAAYLALLMERLENELSASDGVVKKSNPFKYDEEPEETTIQRILDQMNSKSDVDFDKIARSYEKAIWGESDGEYEKFAYNINKKDNGPFFTPLPYNNLNDRGFDILISYGPEAKRQARNLGNLNPLTTVQSINGVHLTAVSSIIGSDGQPIYEQYNFIARDMNTSVQKAKQTPKPVETTNPISSGGGAGPQIMELQIALNTFIDKILVEDIHLKADHVEQYKLAVDGRFGPKTKETVKFFQDYFGLKVNGVADKETWSVLNSITL